MIGILGGTFDPVHLGHLRTAVELREALGLEEVRLLPCGTPPHREPPVASGADRLAMLEAAIAGEPGLAVDTRELERPGPSYMVDTLASFRAELGPGRPLCLLLGTDALAGLERWHRWRRIPELAHLVVARRPGADLPAAGAVGELLAARRVDNTAALREAPAGRILVRDVTLLDISATRIRALLAQGRSVRYLVPEAVLELIHARGLYGGGAARAGRPARR